MTKDMTCEVIHLETETNKNSIKHIDKILDKLEQNNSKLTSICSEIKILTKTHDKRLEYMEKEHSQYKSQIDIDKTEFNRSIERLHDKIESSEDKNENKIDYAIEKLGDKIDDMGKESSIKIDKITNRIDKIEQFKWIVIGGSLVLGALITKLEMLSSFFS